MGTMPEPLSTVNTAVLGSTTSLLDKIVEEQQVSRARIAERYKPVMSTDDLIERENAINYLVDNIMREGIDYGWVPGTKPTAQAKPGEYQAKPTLFKAGAERACAFFGYVPEYVAEKQIEEWTTDKYGEPLFYYTFRCTLSKDSQAVGQGLGSASTWESKYRYRNAERSCPNCGAANIRKSKPRPNQREEPGFYCWERTGGCGATFAANDPRITDQVTGKIPNADVADVINTVQKMAQKRSYVAATLTATGLSGRFTQDMEDISLPEPLDQRNTPTQQAELAQQRIKEERAKAAKQTTENKPASSAPNAAETTASAPAPNVAPKQPYQATDDDLPRNMGGTYDPQPSPTQQRIDEARQRMSGQQEQTQEAPPRGTPDDFRALRMKFLELGEGGVAEYDRIVKKHGAAPGVPYPSKMTPARLAYAELLASFEGIQALNTAGEAA